MNYKRLTLFERNSIEDCLNKNISCRQMARTLGRSNSTVADEVKRNRVIANGKHKGVRASEYIEGKHAHTLCPRLCQWPYVCNGCNSYKYCCTRPIRIEYCGVTAHHISQELLSCARTGVLCNEKMFKTITSAIKIDLSRGLSPYQISISHRDFSISTSTIYKWIGKGYGNLCNLDLRRKVKYRPREKKIDKRPTKHGINRSYKAFCMLDQDIQDSACEMDTVIGRKNDKQCILTLFHRPTKLQIAMLLSKHTTEAVNSALDSLELHCSKELFQSVFDYILTDNGCEFSDYKLLEGSYTNPRTNRLNLYYCDVRASNQKGACEKNHVEIRKIIPKRQGISFDELNTFDIAYINSHVNSQIRKSLNNKSPIEIFISMYGDKGKNLLDTLGIEQINPRDINLTKQGLDKDRLNRGLEAL